MVRHSLAAALWLVAGLLASLLGALSALVGTGAGRLLLTQVAVGALKHVVDGTVEIGDVRGALLTGVTLRNVRVFDLDTTLVAALPRVDATFNPFDLAAGRVVLLTLELRQPVINVVQHRNGRLNVEELLRLGRPSSGPQGPKTLIVFRNVRIDQGTVTLRLQERSAGDVAGHEIDPLDRDGRRRIHRFEHLDARFATLLISSPREPGIHVDIAQLAVTSTDPEFTLTDVVGHVTVVGDSLAVDLSRVQLPASRLSGHGSVRWPRDTLLFDLTVRADSATLGDVHFLTPRFPRAAVVRGGVRLRSHGGRLLEVGLDPLDVRYGGGTLTGRLTAVSAADSGLVAVQGAELVARDFDLDFPRALVDTLPFYGRLSGHTTANGATNALTLEVDWTFYDSLVAGRPASRLRGEGEIDLRAPAGIRFQPFFVEAATVDFGTIRRLAPAVALHGVLGAAGTLTGGLHDARFTGTLTHRDGERPTSLVSGTVGLDTRTDTIGLYADVRANSLSFDGLRGSFPGLPLRGAVTGPITLNGTLAALESHANLESSAGAVRVDGVLMLLASRSGVRDFTLRAQNIDLARWVAGAPGSRLSFTIASGLAWDSAAPPVGALTATLSRSSLVGAALDTGRAALHFAGGRVYLDSLRIGRPGFVTTGAGALGWERPASGVVSLDFNADSLDSLDSLVTWLVGPDTKAKARGRSFRGAAHVLLTFDGALDSMTIEARGTAERLRWRGWEVPAGHGRLVYQPGPVPGLRFDATLDSLRFGRFAFSAASATGRGTRDSLTWFARSRFGDIGAFVTGGRLERRSRGAGHPAGVTVGIDSLSLLLPGGVWLLQHPTEVVVNDSTIAVVGLTVHSVSDSGRIVLNGSLPVRGPADAHIQIEAFPLAGIYTLFEGDTTGVGGTVTASVGLAGTRTDPVYVGSVAVSNGSLPGFRAPLVDGTVEYRERRLDAALHLWRMGQQILTVTAHLPLDLSLIAVAERTLPDTLSVGARVDSVDLSVLEAVTPLVREVRGVFSAEFGVAGTWHQPRLGGVVRIVRAAATIPALNVRYENVTGDLAMSGDTISVRSLSATSGDGRMDVSGFVRLLELTHPVLALKINADDFKALDLKANVTVTASGQLTLTGPVFGATLAGHATVTSGVLYFADLIEKRIINLEAFSDSALESLIQEQRLGPEFQSVFLDSLRIQGLDLDMGNDVWLRSNEANIQLTGTVTLSKERTSYLLSGTLQAPRGFYRLKIGPVTREFAVSEGTVRYFGTPDLDAELNIAAKHTVHPMAASLAGGGDIVVVAHITGTLLVPRVTLEAERQDLSQTDVISYLFFGKPSFELTGDPRALTDQQFVRTAVSVLSGELERTIVSDLGIPLDYVEIRPGASTDPFSGVQLAVGRQLGRKTFLVVNAGFCQGRPVAVNNTIGLSFQYRLGPEFRTEASFEPVRVCSADPALDPPSATVVRQVGFDLIWERRY
jgi:translocation and assembly module TamB